ncbi:hypothetical protein BN7_2877 [Wickerhamomyces ciferrii]|uniref:Uncharacterized protein n=1 Tax=Wickerhamomyces ciferrii (strain ATCC 14091 / BCRC 22168 / CBS 111 / JCM 3599 / NBRC 0793 / NRRL Y-1031 F-60-10) TaxID=1206466 RepID=K0KPM5_WICCF|nr:uncharacterized protein BN7_2877 [Wickerhamomyces ciferrii]CCH43329.1 hypothetical protein BN7_2877 [Wickerhamomyces ciferrii]
MNAEDYFNSPDFKHEVQIEWLVERDKRRSTAMEFHRSFKKGYPSHVLLSNNDTLRRGKFTKLLLGFYGLGPTKRPEEQYPILTRQIVGDCVKGLELSSTIDNVIYKYKGLFDLMPYEKYSTSYFVKRSNILIAQMIAHMKIRAKHFIWNTKLKAIYPVRYEVNKFNRKCSSLVSSLVVKISKALKKSFYIKKEFDLFGFGDKPSLLGPFPVEIWLKVIEEADITSKQSADMFYNSYWIDIIGPYLYTNIYGIVTVRDTFITNRDEAAFFEGGPSYNKELLYGQERYDRYQDLGVNEYEIIDLYPSSLERKHKLETLKSKANGFPITFVKNHESVLKLAALMNKETSLIRKFIKQISIDVFAPQDFMTKEGVTELYDDYSQFYNGYRSTVEVKAVTLIHSECPFIHVLHEFEANGSHDDNGICKKSDEIQHFFQKKRTPSGYEDSSEFTKAPSYDMELSYFNRILNSILHGRREDINIEDDIAANKELVEYSHFDYSRYRNLNRINHKFDLQVFKRKFLKDSNSVKIFIDKVSKPFLCYNVDNNINVSVTITGINNSRVSGECLADELGYIYTFYRDPQMVLLKKMPIVD